MSSGPKLTGVYDFDRRDLVRGSSYFSDPTTMVLIDLPGPD